MNEQVTFIHTTASKLSTLPVVNGQWIVVDDTDRCYYDMGNARHEMSDYLSLLNQPQINGITLTGNRTAAALGIAPTTHASSSTTYGVGTVDEYGHVKVDDALSTTSTNTVQNKVINTALDGKSPTNHASTQTTYGVGSTTDYGHVKVDDALSTSSENPVQNKVITTDLNNVKQALNNEVVTRAKLGAHNLFDGYFRNGLLSVGENYTNRAIDRNEALPNSTGAVSKYFMFGAYLPAGSYVISVNGSDYVSFNRVAIAGTDCVGSSAHLRPSYSFTSAVDGWNYFSIERDAGESDYTDIDFEGHDLKIMITLATDSDTTYRPYVPTNSQLLSYKDNGVLGAKNLLDCSLETLKKKNPNLAWNGNTCTVNGLKITINNDNSITISRVEVSNSDTWVNLTTVGDMPEDNYILSGCPVGSGESTYAIATRNSNNELLFVDENGYTGRFPKSTSSITLYIKRGNNPSSPVTFYPMVRLASDTDPTYQPYAKTNTELTKDTKGLTDNQFGNSCVNLLENEGSSVVTEGITFTVNADKSVSAYGTLEANKNVVFVINANKVYSDFIGKRLKLSGCPKNTGLSACRITAYRAESADGSSGSVFDYGDGVVYEHLNNGTGTRVHYQIEMGNSTSSPVSINTTFKPMITVADMPNSDYAHYVPYAKSNKELTNYTNPIDIAFTPTDATKATLDWGKFYRVGDIVMANVGFLVQNITAGDTVSLGTIPVQSTTPVVSPVCDGYLTKDYAGYIRFMHNQNTIEYFAVKTADTMRVCGTLIFKVKS